MPPAPKKSLGQHFLNSEGICRKIVSLLEPGANDQILEIGPGAGALTGILRDSPHKRLLLIEKDDFWATKQAATGAEVLTLDALKFDWASLEGKWKLVGNLPYNIASPLIWDIFGKCRAWERAVFMTQKEVGERLCAAPNSRKYGALSVWAQCRASAKLEFVVRPGAFRPPPKVDSAVISFWPLEKGPNYPETLAKLLKICFQRRRKQIGGIFRAARLPLLENGLKKFGLDPALRPENLSCQDFMNLAEFWSESHS